ncbi:C39 family peptidase [Deinococcus maricopensis]|uniref:Peptidase C39-like domain-containing protein n=1 Tax=Deinococcus maricopensis (strain DSM 21211 / LMG 22137 / NRRL B-23946 / LB-34) TaxID=709986 RepID=E8U3P7_DEIML|nr:C39 family peptidase [Deinococcus maricopensis]ADV68671.1 hypothetical protein Deima_3042 [Deinococcus maricopensis DSM 21211]
MRLQTKIKYRNQRNNDNDAADGMCNLTSLAMALETVGIGKPSKLPDQSKIPPALKLTQKKFDDMQPEDYLEWVRRVNRYGPRTSEKGIANTAIYMGAEHKRLYSGIIKRQEWEGKIRKHLGRGEGVFFSVDGHIVRLQGMNDKGLIVDDPYGKIKLYKGSGTGNYSWRAYNTRKGEEGPGEDAIWPWGEVESHAMLWVAIVSNTTLTLNSASDISKTDKETLNQKNTDPKKRRLTP